jgi:uncharacterized protein YbjT (DUF2867 family)
MFPWSRRKTPEAAPAPLAPPSSAAELRVLVLPGTGKQNGPVCKALVAAGFDVYGTSRKGVSGDKLRSGATAVRGDYSVRGDVDRALHETGALRVVFTTDYFGAARSSGATETAHGVAIIEASKAAGVQHLIYLSAADADKVPAAVKHVAFKPQVEAHLKASGLTFTVLRPTAFFENLDDPANWNPLKKGQLKFLMLEPLTWVATYDIGRAAAAVFKAREQWAGRTVDCVAWQGDLAEVAKALERVSGAPVTAKLAMPIFLRRLVLTDLHHMCLYFAAHGGGAPLSIPEFRKLVPDAMGPEEWFRHHATYADGTSIAPAAAASTAAAPSAPAAAPAASASAAATTTTLGKI